MTTRSSSPQAISLLELFLRMRLLTARVKSVEVGTVSECFSVKQVLHPILNIAEIEILVSGFFSCLVLLVSLLCYGVPNTLDVTALKVLALVLQLHWQDILLLQLSIAKEGCDWEKFLLVWALVPHQDLCITCLNGSVFHEKPVPYHSTVFLWRQ